MRISLPLNITLGIITELLYTLCIMLAAFFICLLLVRAF
jgi:hypothetical protein